MKYRPITLAAVVAVAFASDAHGQTRSWMQNAPVNFPASQPAAARPPSVNPSVYGVRPAAPNYGVPVTATAPRLLPGSAAPNYATPNYAAPAARPAPYAAPYYTAQVPTPAPPLGGTTVPGPVVAPSITGTPPIYPTPPGAFNTPAPAGSMWNDGSLPAESLPSTIPMNAPTYGAPTPAPPLAGQPNAASQAPSAQPGGYGPQPNYTPPAGYGPPPSYASSPSDYGASPMGSSCEPETSFDPSMAFEDPGARTCGPWFASISFLMLTRDAPNNVGLSYLQTQPQLTVLNSEQATSHDWEPGGEVRFGRAMGDRWAIEGVYWAVDSFQEQVGVHRESNDLNSRLDFDHLFFQGSPLSDVFDNSRDHRFRREDNFENIEINLMQQALVVDPAQKFGLTSFAGVRYFRFDEMTHYEATAAGVDYGTVEDGSPSYSDYRVTMHNRMIGGQFGARGTMNLGCKLRLFAIPRFGIYDNNISMKQHVCRTINMGSEKNDVTLMGQLDVGASYQILPCVSIFGAYKAMGFAGVATADDNMARSFEATGDIGQINSSGSLILHGWQAGVQTQF